MRKTPDGAEGVAPAPLTCGRKKRAGDTDAPGETRNLGSVPCDREEDRRVPKNAEIVSVVGIFPNVLSRKDHIFPESLLQTGVELVAPTGGEGSRV